MAFGLIFIVLFLTGTVVDINIKYENANKKIGIHASDLSSRMRELQEENDDSYDYSTDEEQDEYFEEVVSG